MNDDLYDDPLLEKSDESDLETEPVVEDTVLDDVEFIETDGEGEEKKGGEKLKKLREELKQAQAEARDHLTALQRARADYVNLKRELDEVRDTTKKKATERVILDFLPVLDSFDMAMGNKEAWEAVDKNWRIGIEHICTQLKNTLENHGVTAIEKAGVEFNPHLHEPIETKETDDKKLDHKIEKIIQKGYQMGDKVIRPARVVVWKHS